MAETRPNAVQLARTGEATVGSRGRRAAIRELGTTGTANFSGIITDEYLTALKTPAMRYNVWRQMRADAQVSALISVIVLPLQASAFKVVANENDPDRVRANMIADRFDENLQTMDMLWDDFIRQAFLSIVFGFSLFETVYRRNQDDRLLEWQKFAPRSQSTITRWNADKKGVLQSVRQEVTNSGQALREDIPVEKLLRFTYRQEASNFEGRPMLRDCYRHWWLKDMLYNIEAIGAERNGVGFPVMKIPRDVFVEEEPIGQKLIRAVRINEEGGFVLPADYEFDFAKPRPFAFGKAIEHHNRMIALSGLTQFLTLGAGGETGSYALSKAHGQFFIMALGGILKHFTDTMTNVAFRRLVDLNWGTEVPAPTLMAELIVIDPIDIAEILSMLVESDLLRKGPKLREVIRKRLNIPSEEEGDEELPPEPEPKQPFPKKGATSEDD